MQNFLVISALGEDRPGIVQALSEAIKECGCNISDSRMAVLGGEFSIILLLSGAWSAVAKIESALPRLEKQLDLTLISKRTGAPAGKANMVSYMIEVVAMDHPGIVQEVTQFFAGRSINIEEMFTSTYPAAHTGTPMFSLNMNISVPGEISIATLRGEFMDLCDSLNLDAIMGPIK